MQSKPTDIYIHAILNGDTAALLPILSKEIVAFSPTSPDAISDPLMITFGLGLVSGIVSDFRLVRTYASDENWHAAVFEGLIDGQLIQFSDHLHLSEENLIDRIEIFMRPASVADLFYHKMSAKIAGE